MDVDLDNETNESTAPMTVLNTWQIMFDAFDRTKNADGVFEFSENTKLNGERLYDLA